MDMEEEQEFIKTKLRDGINTFIPKGKLSKAKKLTRARFNIGVKKSVKNFKPLRPELLSLTNLCTWAPGAYLA